MSRPSLEAFVELSQHPYFGSFVEKINVSPIIDVMLSITTFLQSGTFEGTDVTEIASLYLTTQRDARKARTCESADQLLSVAFKAFAQRQQHLKLEFCDNEHNAVGPRDPLHDEAFERRVSMWKLNWSSTIERTTKAVTSHGCTVTELSIHESDLKRCSSHYKRYTDDFESQLGSLSEKLVRLSIRMNNKDIDATTWKIQRIVSSARNLKFLDLKKLGAWGSLEPQDYPQILDCVLSTCLETIVIGQFEISEQELLEFLGRQRGTLKNLRLLTGCLFQGSCMSLIAWIRDNLPSLVHLELSMICDSPDHTDCPVVSRKSYRVSRGDNMQARLADILNGKYEKKVKKVKIEEVDETEQVEEVAESEQNEEINEPEQAEEVNEPEQVEADDG